MTPSVIHEHASTRETVIIDAAYRNQSLPDNTLRLQQHFDMSGLSVPQNSHININGERSVDTTWSAWPQCNRSLYAIVTT